MSGPTAWIVTLPLNAGKSSMRKLWYRMLRNAGIARYYNSESAAVCSLEAAKRVLPDELAKIAYVAQVWFA